MDPANPLKTDRSGFGGRRAPGVAIDESDTLPAVELSASPLDISAHRLASTDAGLLDTTMLLTLTLHAPLQTGAALRFELCDASQ